MKTRSKPIAARTPCMLVLAILTIIAPLFAQEIWNQQVSPTTKNLVSVAYGQGVFVAVGDDGAVLRSADYGQTWENRSDPDVSLGGLNSVAFGNGVFMAGAGGEILVSTDLGVTWHPATPAPLWLTDVAYGNNRWFAAGDAISASLNDGTNWSKVAADGSQAVALTFNGDIGVAVGGTIAVSQDGGLHWTDVAHGLFNWQVAVAYGNGLYVSVGGVFGNAITKTSDPLTWTEAGSTNTTYSGFTSVTHGAGTFVIVGNAGLILRSNGQQPWTPATKVTTKMLRDVAYGNGTFVAVGHNGTILTSLTSGQPPEINSSLSASGTVGTAFSYAITALNDPTGFDAENLPPGLTINTNTGVISGIPTQAGSFDTIIAASNPQGTDTATLAITIGTGGGTGFRVNIYTAVELEFNTVAGKLYQVESSPDLASWSDCGSPIAGNGQTQHLLYSTRNPNERFFRVREQ